MNKRDCLILRHCNARLIAAAVIGWWCVCTGISAAVAGPVTVTVQPANDIVYRPTNEAPATINSANDTVLSAEVTGVVSEISVRVGDMLSAGDLIAKLDCEEHLRNVEQAWAEMQTAQAQAESAKRRYVELENSGDEQASVRLEAETRKTVAVAKAIRLSSVFRESQARTTKCEVRSPFDAVLVERITSVGELVAPATPLVRVLDSERVETISVVPEHEITGLRESENMHFTAGSDRFPIVLRAVIPLQSDDRSLQVRFDLVGTEKPLPGIAGRIEWQSRNPVIPSRVLVRGDRRLGIFIVAAGKARYVPVEGTGDGGPASIPDIADDALIVVEGRHALADGDAVKVVAARSSIVSPIASDAQRSEATDKQ